MSIGSNFERGASHFSSDFLLLTPGTQLTEVCHDGDDEDVVEDDVEAEAVVGAREVSG